MRPVAQRDDDNGLGSLEQGGRVDSFLQIPVHVLHRPGVPRSEPMLDPFDVCAIDRGGIGDSHVIEAERQGSVLNLLFKAHEGHYTTSQQDDDRR